MGWGKILGGFAKDFAKGYVEERGVKGTLEDVGDIAKGIKGFFSDSSDNSSEVSWDDLTDSINQLRDENKYSDALDLLDQYYQEYEDGEPDVYYYLWRSHILIDWLELETQEESFREIDKALQEAIREGRSFNESELNAEFKELKERQYNFYNFKKWYSMDDMFWKLLAAEKPQKALDILENHYTKNAKDFYYYDSKYQAIQAIAQSSFNQEQDCSYDNELKTQLSYLEEMKNCLKGMQSNLDSSSENQQKAIENCKEAIEWQNINISNLKCNFAIERHDFDEAQNIIDRELKYSFEKGYLLLCSRIASKRLAYLVECNEQSAEIIENAISLSEIALKKATENDNDPESKREVINTVVPRIEAGKDYLNTLTAGSENNNNCDSSDSNAEQEYIEEIKACYSDDRIISDRERRLLDKLRKNLGISEERAAQLESQVQNPELSDNEKEFLAELRECLTDGVISDKERRLLNKLRDSLGISESRASELEAIIKNQ